jgi:hypothetical protein
MGRGIPFCQAGKKSIARDISTSRPSSASTWVSYIVSEMELLALGNIIYIIFQSLQQVAARQGSHGLNYKQPGMTTSSPSTCQMVLLYSNPTTSVLRMPTPFSDTGHRGKLPGISPYGSRNLRRPISGGSESREVSIPPLHQGQRTNRKWINKTPAATRDEGVTGNTREMARVSPTT